MATETMLNVQDPIWEFFLRFGINVIVLYVVIYLIYQRYSIKKTNMFSFFLMGIMLFVICYLLKKIEMNMGMALGLFAVFSIIRYRTENMATKDMAYLFTILGISVINAMFSFPRPVRGTILVNLIVILSVFLLEITLKKYNVSPGAEGLTKADKKAKKKADKADKERSNRYEILYDNLSLLNPGRKADLHSDISRRTGIEIEKIEIRRIDLIASNAILDVYFVDNDAMPGKTE